MLDRYVAGVVERVSPEAPVPVVRVRDERSAIGGAANVAANVLALGADCGVIGLVGDDGEGAELVEALVALGAGVDGVMSAADRPTTSKTRVMAGPQQIVRFDRESDAPARPEEASRIIDSVLSLAGAHDVLIVEDYDKGVLGPDVIDALREAGRRHGIPLVVDPKRRNFFDYSGATFFKPNAKEMADAFGEEVRPDDDHWMEEARNRLGCEHLLVTRGSRGMVLRSAGARIAVPAVARAVFDVSGAGDTVTAVIALALAAGADPVEASLLANHAAAVEVARSGVATVRPAEVLAQVNSLA